MDTPGSRYTCTAHWHKMQGTTYPLLRVRSGMGWERSALAHTHTHTPHVAKPPRKPPAIYTHPNTPNGHCHFRRHITCRHSVTFWTAAPCGVLQPYHTYTGSSAVAGEREGCHRCCHCCCYYGCCSGCCSGCNLVTSICMDPAV